MYIEKQITLLYLVYDADFEIRPNEPKLIIGLHYLRKNLTKICENWSFLTIGEAVGYLIITDVLHGFDLLSYKICMVL